MNVSPELEKVIAAFMEQGKRQKREKVEQYRRLNQYVRPGQILFVGSSLMEQFPINELLMDLGLPFSIYNRGVGGFTTTELAEVLDVCVLDLAPKHIFINIGTNDMNDADYCVDDLIERYESILNTIKERLPETKLYLLAYYPVNEAIGRQDPLMGELFKLRTNQRIRETNHAVGLLAERVGGTYLDLNADLVDEDGNMKAEYTVEGMHMYADGYVAILKRLLPLLESIKE